MEIRAANPTQAWGKILKAFAAGKSTRTNSRHGVAFDIPGLTIWIENIGDQGIPIGYRYPELVHDYGERLFGGQQGKSLLYQRLSRSKNFTDEGLDQTSEMIRLLREDPESRAAVFSTWYPPSDLGGEFPISPVGGSLRILGGRLMLFVTARSTDMWVGFVPEILTFARYGEFVSRQLGLSAPRLCYQAWSAHMYETDLLAYTDGLR